MQKMIISWLKSQQIVIIVIAHFVTIPRARVSRKYFYITGMSKLERVNGK